MQSNHFFLRNISSWKSGPGVVKDQNVVIALFETPVSKDQSPVPKPLCVGVEPNTFLCKLIPLPSGKIVWTRWYHMPWPPGGKWSDEMDRCLVVNRSVQIQCVMAFRTNNLRQRARALVLTGLIHFQIKGWLGKSKGRWDSRAGLDR